VDYCKSDVLMMEGVLPKVVDAQRCTWCLQCEAICPDFAIEIREAETQKAADLVEGSGEAVAGRSGKPNRSRA